MCARGDGGARETEKETERDRDKYLLTGCSRPVNQPHKVIKRNEQADAAWIYSHHLAHHLRQTDKKERDRQRTERLNERETD